MHPNHNNFAQYQSNIGLQNKSQVYKDQVALAAAQNKSMNKQTIT